MGLWVSDMVYCVLCTVALSGVNGMDFDIFCTFFYLLTKFTVVKLPNFRYNKSNLKCAITSVYF